MLFSSPVFLFLFLPAVLALYALAPRAARNLVLLVASLVFYAWGEPEIVVVMLASIAVNWAFGRVLARPGRGAGARTVVGLAVAFNLGLLGFFKYAGFLWDSASGALAALGFEPLGQLGEIHLPIGISFFTFQALSYVVDVYRGDGPSQRSPVDFGLYIALFPQLIAGPIVRYRDVAAQIADRRTTLAGFAYGARRFAVGLGKKVLIANVVAEQADAIFALESGQLTAPVAWLGTVCYTVQIYFDFSGYSDMAIGLGRMFGFRFLENFDHPYVSRSVTEFWRRWHMSLSRWFRDYLYIPLGGNRRGPARTYVNLLVVFFLCGLWHGAAWNFVVWGLFHGAFLVVERVLALDPARPRRAALGHAYTLLVAMVGWVFFRSESLGGAVRHLAAMAGLGAGDGVAVHAGLYLDSLVVTCLAAGVVGSVPWVPRVAAWRERRLERGAGGAVELALELGVGAATVLVLVASASMLAAGTYNPFIYFRF